MKNTKLKRLASLFMALALTLSVSVLPSFAAPKAVPGENILPANIVITACENELSIDSGELNCYGYTEVGPSYDAGVTVELQRLGATWTTVHTWTDKGIAGAMVDEYISPASGTYRLKLTHKAYTKGTYTVLETIEKYSSVVYY